MFPLYSSSAAASPIGIRALEVRQGELGADIGPLQAAGVPGFAPLVDSRHYLDYHHTAADTLDKIDPANLQSEVAIMGVLSRICRLLLWILVPVPGRRR
jgi:hypothetical protein